MSSIKNYSIIRLTKDLITTHQLALLRIDEDVVWERWSIDKFLEDRDQKWNFSLLALSNEQPIGYIIASSKIISIHIHYFVIHKNWRGIGVGAAMLNNLKKLSKNSGLKFITLKSYAFNENAINYYKKFGFVQTSKDIEKGQIELQLSIADVL